MSLDCAVIRSKPTVDVCLDLLGEELKVSLAALAVRT